VNDRHRQRPVQVYVKQQLLQEQRAWIWKAMASSAGTMPMMRVHPN
jgi:hypothetical protein